METKVIERTHIWEPDYKETVQRLRKYYTKGYTFSVETHEYKKQNWSWRGDDYWLSNETDHYLVIHWDGTGLAPEQVKKNIAEADKGSMRDFLNKYGMVKDEEHLEQVLNKIYKFKYGSVPDR